jgi:hypothetical protein
MTTTTKDVESEILERASLTREAVVLLPMFTKFFDGAGRTWEAGKAHPGNPALTVHSMFKASVEDGNLPGDVRVYAFPATQEVPFSRFVVNRQFPGFSSESMGDEAFMDEIAAELRDLALEKGVLEECPNEECEALVLADAETCSECGTKLIEDEAEEEDPAKSDTMPSPAAPEVVPTVEKF